MIVENNKYIYNEKELDALERSRSDIEKEFIKWLAYSTMLGYIEDDWEYEPVTFKIIPDIKHTFSEKLKTKIKM